MTAPAARQKVVTRFTGSWRKDFALEEKAHEQKPATRATERIVRHSLPTVDVGTTIVFGGWATTPAAENMAAPQSWYGTQAEALAALMLPPALKLPTSYSHISEANKNRNLYLIKEKSRLSKDFATDNWDEEGAKALSPSTIEAFTHFINALFWKSTLPKVFPFTDGSVGLIWRWDNKVLTASIDDKRMVSFSYISKNEDAGELYGHIKLSGGQIPDPLNRIIPCR